MPKQNLSRRGLLGAVAASLPVRFSPGRAAEKAPARAVLDTDTYNEIDDQYAVAYALLAPEAMRLEAIYAAPFLNSRSRSAGDGMEKSYEEILRVLDRMRRKDYKEVYRGSQTFMTGAGRPVESPAAANLIERAMKGGDGRLHVLTVGAPTNVSSAILLEPKIKDRIVVVWLGGQPYDRPSAREFNLQQDIHASRVLYDSGVNLVNIPTTNISEMLRTTTAELERFIKGKSPIGTYLFDIFVEYAREHKQDDSKPWSKVIWDISAVAWLVNARWVETKTVPSPILKDGFTWGHDPKRHPVTVATHVDRDGIFGDLFARLVRA